MESWGEALDVDDSDLPSLLRPCKKRHNQTSISHSQHLDSTPFILIPGPAGAVQLAMLRKKHDRNLPSDEAPIPTQDYLRKAVQDADEDQHFKSTPWLHATHFLTTSGLTCTPLSSVNKLLKSGKVDQVIVVIKSSAPNGLGDLTVTLKDLTATIGGSIHRKILTETEYAKDISIGAVLILRNVSVFAPSRTARYLNITRNNVVKVFCKDSEPQLIKNYFASTVKYAAPDTDCGEKTRMFQKPCSQEQTEVTMNDIGQSAVTGGNLHNNQKVKGNSIEIADDNQVVALEENDKGPKGGNLPGSHQCSTIAANLGEDTNDKETRRMGGVDKQRQPLISRTSVPEWTDEQLDELFDMGFEDGASFL